MKLSRGGEERRKKRSRPLPNARCATALCGPTLAPRARFIREESAMKIVNLIWLALDNAAVSAAAAAFGRPRYVGRWRTGRRPAVNRIDCHRHEQHVTRARALAAGSGGSGSTSAGVVGRCRSSRRQQRRWCSPAVEARWFGAVAERGGKAVRAAEAGGKRSGRRRRRNVSARATNDEPNHGHSEHDLRDTGERCGSTAA